MKKAPSRCSLHDKAPFFSLLSPPGARPAEGDEAHSSARLLVRKMPHSDFVLRSTAAPEERPDAAGAALSHRSSREEAIKLPAPPVFGGVAMPRRLYVWCRRPGTSQAKTPASASSNTALPRAPPSPPPRARKLKTVPLWDQFVVDLSDVRDTALVQARTPKSERKFACQRLPSNAAGVVT
ncbi:hypothetical protein MRX96_012315 [Rhipicephalus microplus]